MSRYIFVCLKLCLLIVICTADKWELSDYQTSEELAAKNNDKNIKLAAKLGAGTKDGTGVKYGLEKLHGVDHKSGNGARDINIWPEGRIPFYIDEYSYDKILRDQIREHLDYATTSTSLIFEEIPNPPKDNSERWVFFVNRRGQLDCKDYSTDSFTNSGVQFDERAGEIYDHDFDKCSYFTLDPTKNVVTDLYDATCTYCIFPNKVILGYDCLQTRGPIAALVLALAGVPPQHNAPNRDDFVKVKMESILPEKRAFFKKLSPDSSRGLNLNSFPYDYSSVGHYHSYKYTIDGSTTVIGILQGKTGKYRNWTEVISENADYSPVDIEKINHIYKAITVNQTQPGIQLEECKALYRPDSNIEETEAGNKKLYGIQSRVFLAEMSSLEVPESKRRKQ